MRFHFSNPPTGDTSEGFGPPNVVGRVAESAVPSLRSSIVTLLVRSQPEGGRAANTGKPPAPYPPPPSACSPRGPLASEPIEVVRRFHEVGEVEGGEAGHGSGVEEEHRRRKGEHLIDRQVGGDEVVHNRQQSRGGFYPEWLHVGNGCLDQKALRQAFGPGRPGARSKRWRASRERHRHRPWSVPRVLPGTGVWHQEGKDAVGGDEGVDEILEPWGDGA